MSKWFGKPASGVNNDIERHRAKEAELTAVIDRLRAEEGDPVFINAYIELRDRLRSSRAEAVSNLGKKKG